MARLAPSLISARADINVRWPNRDRTSDGWIGDAAHMRIASDHNPNDRGVVDAIDVDQDGIHVPTVVAGFMLHPATNYVICNRRYYGSENRFRPTVYTGNDPHTSHIHESIKQSPTAENNGVGWYLIDQLPIWSTMNKGKAGFPVTELQAILNGQGASLVLDGDFGPATDAAVRAFQRAHNVQNSVANGNGDGIVGQYTRTALFTA